MHFSKKIIIQSNSSWNCTSCCKVQILTAFHTFPTTTHPQQIPTTVFVHILKEVSHIPMSNPTLSSATSQYTHTDTHTQLDTRTPLPHRHTAHTACIACVA